MTPDETACRAALLDLVAAWVWVHRPKVCVRCGGQRMIDHPGPVISWREGCPVCHGTGRHAPVGSPPPG